MRVLARSGHPDSARPVVVEVGEHLDEQRQHPGDVLFHIVGGGVDVALVRDCDTRKKSYLNKML